MNQTPTIPSNTNNHNQYGTPRWNLVLFIMTPVHHTYNIRCIATCMMVGQCIIYKTDGKNCHVNCNNNDLIKKMTLAEESKNPQLRTAKNKRNWNTLQELSENQNDNCWEQQHWNKPNNKLCEKQQYQHIRYYKYKIYVTRPPPTARIYVRSSSGVRTVRGPSVT